MLQQSRQNLRLAPHQSTQLAACLKQMPRSWRYYYGFACSCKPNRLRCSLTAVTSNAVQS